MTAYYNEFDPFAAEWLRQLIAAGMIAPGVVDERSIEDVKPEELFEYDQVHFFAGIGGWSLALRLAGWPDDRPVWSGSCPCQPFSVAGRGDGIDDERHLWPAMRWLVDQCRPSTVFGEQVASKDGREWFGNLRSDLERMDYEVGGADLCAPGVNAPHVRQRLFWVANTNGAEPEGGELRLHSESGVCNGVTRRTEQPEAPRVAVSPRPWGRGRKSLENGENDEFRGPSAVGWVPCWDGAIRPLEPGVFPLANGIPDRVGLLRGYGNAIVPQVGAEFIAAFMECRP